MQSAAFNSSSNPTDGSGGGGGGGDENWLDVYKDRFILPSKLEVRPTVVNGSSEEGMSVNGKPCSDQAVKVLTTGEPGVGKSSFIVRYFENHFYDCHISTIGVGVMGLHLI